MPDIPSREWYEPPDEPEDDLDPEAEAERAADERYEFSRDPEFRRHRQQWLSSTENPFA